jgi:hypothetical protein
MNHGIQGRPGAGIRDPLSSHGREDEAGGCQSVCKPFRDEVKNTMPNHTLQRTGRTVVLPTLLVQTLMGGGFAARR